MIDKNLLPERLSVMWQNSRKVQNGWEVPIQAASSNPSIGAGNVVAIVYLGGSGGVSSTKDSVEAMAEAIARSYNDRETLAAMQQRLDAAMATIDKLRARIEVDECDVDEAGIGDLISNENSPKIVAWMQENGLEFVDRGDAVRDPGIWDGDVLVCEMAPVTDERVINYLAMAVGRPPLDILSEIASMEWSCEHCGKSETQAPRHCDFCRGGMCFECTEKHDEQDICPIQEGKNV